MKDLDLKVDKEQGFFIFSIPEPVQSEQSKRLQSDPIDYRLIINKQ